MKRFWALLLALAMLSGPCAFAEETAAPVFAVGELSGNFNPFFAEAEGDRLVAALANGALLTTARGGDIVRSGIAGETIDFDTTPYDYTSLADAEVERNADGSADYTLTLPRAGKLTKLLDTDWQCFGGRTEKLKRLAGKACGGELKLTLAPFSGKLFKLV